MYAAVVSSFDSAPRFEEFPTPTPSGDHPAPHRRHGQRATSARAIPVGRIALHQHRRAPARAGDRRSRSDSRWRVALLHPSRHGRWVPWRSRRSSTFGAASSYRRTATRSRRCVDESGDVRHGSPCGNGSPSGPGQSVLVLGATGSAGRLAIQVAKHLGAAHVIAAGRGASRRPGSRTSVPTSRHARRTARHGAGGGARAVTSTSSSTTSGVRPRPPRCPKSSRVAPTEARRSRGSRSARWPARLPRSRPPRFGLPGSRSSGAVRARSAPCRFVAELPALAAQITAGAFLAETRVVPLAEVEAAWAAPTGQERIVIVP